MTSHATARFWKAYTRLEATTKQQALDAYRLFKGNPYHPSLHFKRVHSIKPIYSARVNVNYRVLGVRDGDDLVWFWIGPHDEYEKLLTRL